MLQKLAGLPSWFGILSATAMATLAVAPVTADETVVTREFTFNQEPTAESTAAGQERVADIHETALVWDANHPNQLDVPTLRLAGVAIMRFRSASGGFSAQQRYEMVQTRLVKALSGVDYDAHNSVTTALVNGASAIFLRGHLLVTVTEVDAIANNGSAAGLAETWAANLRRGLAQSVQ